jgi:hypothetical protein
MILSASASSSEPVPPLAAAPLQILLVILLYLFTVPALIFLADDRTELLQQPASPGFYSVLAIVAGVSLGTLWAVNAARAAWPFYVLVFVFFVARIVWYLALTPDPVVDFLRYWEFAHQFGTGAKDFPAMNVYECRAIPYFLPITYLFGASLTALAVVNSAAVAIVSLVFYRLTARIFAPAVAAACVVFANMAPEMFGASAIPSHDIAGLLYVTLLLVVLDLAWRAIASGPLNAKRIAFLVVASVAAAVLIFLNSLQRYPEALVFAVLASWLVLVGAQFMSEKRAKGTRRLAKLGALSATVGVVVVLTVVLANSAGALRTQCFSEDENLENFISYSHSSTRGSWGYKESGVRPMLRNVDAEARADLLKALVLSDIADDPMGRWNALRLKAGRLFGFGDLGGFYLYQWRDRRAESPVYDSYVSVNRAYDILLNLMLVAAPFCLWLAYRGGRVGFSPVAYLPIMMIAVLIFFLLVAGEMQSRYLLPIYFFAAPAFGAVFAMLGSARDKPAQAAPERWSARASAGFAILLAAPLIVFLLASLTADRALGVADGRLADLKQAATDRPQRPLPSVSSVSTEQRAARRLRAAIPVFGDYARWLWANEPGTQGVRYHQCGFRPGAVLEARGLAGLLMLDDAYAISEAAPPAGEGAACAIGIGDKEADCLPGGQFSMSEIKSDDSGCVTIDHRISVPEDGLPAASWLGLVRFQHPSP